jgi:hypothetical protein
LGRSRDMRHAQLHVRDGAAFSEDHQRKTSPLEGLRASQRAYHPRINRRYQDLCLTRPADSLKSLGQDGVAKVVGRVHPIGIHGGEVLDLEFDERRSNLGRVAKLVGESICVGSAFGLGSLA